ncbi:hypothetical protein MMC2321_03032 [Chitinophaga sp. MM2321]
MIKSIILEWFLPETAVKNPQIILSSYNNSYTLKSSILFLLCILCSVARGMKQVIINGK